MKISRRSTNLRTTALFIAIILILYTFAVLFIGIDYAYKKNDLGTSGDFIGGYLNPIFTISTFLAILISLYMQNEDLNLTRQELIRSANALEGQIKTIDLQNFENSLHKMISNLNNIVDSLEVIEITRDKEQIKHRGRAVFKYLSKDLRTIYRTVRLRRQITKKLTDERDLINLSYYSYWKKHQNDISHYFRTLFQIFKYINKHPLGSKHHTNIVRSTLTNNELFVLFYNCLSKDGNPFSYYSHEYEIFDNLNKGYLIKIDHANYLSRKSFGNK